MSENIRIIPLGGFDKIGMNMMLIENDDTIIAIDCGMSFPPHNMPGIDTSIPDVDYLIENSDKLKGIVLTHGHEDHIGAIPYIIESLNVPIYGTPLTIALVEKKLTAHGIKKYKTKVIRQKNTIVLGSFKVEFITTNHSIPDAVMLAVHTPAGTVIHTGDFKIDYSPITGDSTDLRRIAALGSKGVLALITDSTNSLVPGSSPSESEVSASLDLLFNLHKENRLIIATFASNMDRVQQIITLAKKYNRKVVLLGDTMLSIFEAAKKLNYLNYSEDVLIDIKDVPTYESKEIIFLTTGNHGEPINCLTEIAEGTHDNIKLLPGDTVLFSSIAIHGSENLFSKTMNLLEEQGANIIFQDIHATGHACIDELKLMYNLAKPKYAIPAHGEYRYRKSGAAIAQQVGIDRKNILMLDNGDVLSLSADEAKLIDHISLKEVLIDGLGIGNIGKNIISDRTKMGKNGIVIIETCFGASSGRLVAPTRITTRGFVNTKVSTDILPGLEDAVKSEIARLIAQGVTGNKFDSLVQKAAEKYIINECDQRPLVIVLTNEIVL
ncbi:ribonuclease J [Butyrivibrio sp. INlla21]|uniref:ribonuclease J n=1 Tax=Butyrivibrio sp. INlla21 TaxID=1520811 RepID=UPI0008E4BA40|nr:RNase J family beta-CASP ribonuclease [Butyrivibrio sp. INlla21]SFU52691.1 ribonuclease J [Butyrivibrio sp. INlla21]